MSLHKTTVALAGLTVLSMTLAGCAGGAAPDSSGEDADTVTFRSWSPIEQTTQQMVDAFEADNPGTAIDATIFNYPEYLVDLQTRASSNTFPDIVGLQPGALTQQYRSNLLPLQDCAAETWGDDWQEMFYPIGIEQRRGSRLMTSCVSTCRNASPATSAGQMGASSSGLSRRHGRG